MRPSCEPRTDARVLPDAVAKVYGFVEVVLMGAPLDDRRGWLKLPTGEGVAQSGARGADKGRPAVFVFAKLKERRPTVLITDSDHGHSETAGVGGATTD